MINKINKGCDMEKIKHIVGDTVTLEINVSNISDNIDTKLYLYKTYSSDGMKNLIKIIPPTKIDKDNNTITFVYNTDDFLKGPTTYYGHFVLNNNGIIMNNYYRIRATF